MTGSDPRRQAFRQELTELSAELRQWVAWQRELGVVGFPIDQDSGVQAPSAARSQMQGQGQGPPASHPRPSHPRPSHPRPTTGVQRPHARPEGVIPSSPGPAGRPRRDAPPSSHGGESLEQIRHDLGACTRCKLHAGRSNIVFGVGAATADLLIVGEGPGYHEDRTGEPFVGRAGRLLNRMLAAIGLERRTVYICNVVKCRPPNNRDPEPDEVAACSPFMHRQIASIKPKVIMTVGSFAGRSVLGMDGSVGKLRSEVRSFQDIPVVATYHPAYLLRTPRMKRTVWEDLLKVRDILESGSDAAR